MDDIFGRKRCSTLADNNECACFPSLIKRIAEECEDMAQECLSDCGIAVDSCVEVCTDTTCEHSCLAEKTNCDSGCLSSHIGCTSVVK